MTAFNLAPPELETFDRSPSWCNSRGHIDRSACIEITVAEARVLAGCVPHKVRMCDLPWERRMGLSERAAGTRDFSPRGLPDGSMPVWRYRRLSEPNVRPLPGQKPARNGRGRIASGVVVVRARDLYRLHEQRSPRRLAGDFRTSRAMAMRTRFARTARNKANRFRCRVDRANPIAWPADRNLDGNPNRGAMRTKMIGLRRDWSQGLRIEMWQYPGRIRPAYYFVCPGGCPPPEMDYRHNQFNDGRRSSVGVAAMPVVPAASLSTCRAGRKDPKTRRCPQRCLKLLMVQCTAAEQRDAMIAQRWIASLPAGLRSQAHAAVHRLSERYSPLFEPRMLMCPRCLGVRYGNHPETVRRGWRRRNGKADVSIRRGGDANTFLRAPLKLSRASAERVAEAHARAREAAAIDRRQRLLKLVPLVKQQLQQQEAQQLERARECARAAARERARAMQRASQRQDSLVQRLLSDVIPQMEPLPEIAGIAPPEDLGPTKGTRRRCRRGCRRRRPALARPGVDLARSDSAHERSSRARIRSRAAAMSRSR